MRKIMGAVALMLVLTSCGGGGGDDAKPSAPVTVTVNAEGDPVEADEEVSTERELLPTDFSLELRVKDKQCFGSAGCNVTVEVEPAMTDLSRLEGLTVELTYEITGIEDGPLVGTLEFDEEGNYSRAEEDVRTTHAGATVKVKPTHVESY